MGIGARLRELGAFPGPLRKVEAEEGSVRPEGTCASSGSEEVQGSAQRALGTLGIHDVKPGTLESRVRGDSEDMWVGGGNSRLPWSLD